MHEELTTSTAAHRLFGHFPLLSSSRVLSTRSSTTMPAYLGSHQISQDRSRYFDRVEEVDRVEKEAMSWQARGQAYQGVITLAKYEPVMNIHTSSKTLTGIPGIPPSKTSQTRPTANVHSTRQVSGTFGATQSDSDFQRHEAERRRRSMGRENRTRQ